MRKQDDVSDSFDTIERSAMIHATTVVDSYLCGRFGVGLAGLLSDSLNDPSALEPLAAISLDCVLEETGSALDGRTGTYCGTLTVEGVAYAVRCTVKLGPLGVWEIMRIDELELRSWTVRLRVSEPPAARYNASPA